MKKNSIFLFVLSLLFIACGKETIEKGNKIVLKAGITPIFNDAWDLLAGSYGSYTGNDFKCGDFDGDGKDDVMKFAGDGRTFIQYANDGFTDGWDAVVGSYGAPYPTQFAIYYNNAYGWSDGKAEVIKLCNDGKKYIMESTDGYTDGWDREFITPNNGDAIRVDKYGTIYRFTNYGYYYIDRDFKYSPNEWDTEIKNMPYFYNTEAHYDLGYFDSDQWVDAIIYLKNGQTYIRCGENGFNNTRGVVLVGSYGSPVDGNTFRVGDFNGDGLSDVIKFAGDGRTFIKLNNGGGFDYSGMKGAFDLQPGSFGAPSNNDFEVADFDGDGRDDVIKFGSDGKTWIQYAGF